MEIRNENGLVKLIPSEGMRLTDGKTVAGGRVYVGTAGAAESWREVTEAEAEAIVAERRAKAEAAVAEKRANAEK